MNRILICAILLIMTCALFCGPASAEEDPIVVRVGDFSYPLSVAQESLDSAIRLQEAMSGAPLTEAERAQMAQDVIDNLMGVGLIEAKLTEAGQHDFTGDEQEEMHAAARARYEELWQGVYQTMISQDMEATEEQVVEALSEEGYTLNALYREFEVSERQKRAIALYVPDMILTEKQLEEFYETEFLAPDRARYSDNIPLYEREILAAGNESFYTPEGYRSIRQILLEYPEAVEAGLKRYISQIDAAGREVADAVTKLNQVATTTHDWSEMDAPRAVYDAALARLEEANQAYVEARKAIAMPLIQDTLDAIEERLDAGIDFKSLISEYSADTSEQNVSGAGYPLHPASEGWPEAFIAAGMALQKPGDVSEPVLTEKGIHILYYDSDIPSGDHVLTEDEKALLKTSALYYYQTLALIERFEAWKTEYAIETHPELLNY